MFGLGVSHLILLGLLGLIFIGPEELPQVARQIGRFLNELKRGGDSFRDEIRKAAELKDEKISKPNLTEAKDQPPTESTPKDPS